MAVRKPTGKLSYCMNCKDDTETIVVSKPSGFPLLKIRIRICRSCAQRKEETELEMEKLEKYR